MKDLSGFRPDGKEMSDDGNVFTLCFGLRVGGDAIAFVLPARSLALFRPGRANRFARAGRHVQAADGVA